MNKVAILIDGGFYLKRLSHVRKDIDTDSPDDVASSIRELVRGHLYKLAKIQHSNLFSPVKNVKKKLEFTLEPNSYAQHYRTFYYDAPPLKLKTHTPISRKPIDFEKTDVFKFRTDFFDALRKERNLALRLGETKVNPKCKWQIRPNVMDDLLKKKKAFSDLKDEDFAATVRQKGVDMRMGLDMASIALKKQANIFVLITGDADFVPATKLVRREGCEVILDRLNSNTNIPPDLFEHIDGLVYGFKHTDD